MANTYKMVEQEIALVSRNFVLLNQNLNGERAWIAIRRNNGFISNLPLSMVDNKMQNTFKLSVFSVWIMYS